MTKTLKVGGRELALILTMEALDEIEKEIGEPLDLFNINQSLVSKLNDRHILVSVATIMAQAGERAMGIEPDFDAAWMKRHLRPGSHMKLFAAALEAITDGIRMETGDGEEDEEIDVVLEELKKKRSASV